MRERGRGADDRIVGVDVAWGMCVMEVLRLRSGMQRWKCGLGLVGDLSLGECGVNLRVFHMLVLEDEASSDTFGGEELRCQLKMLCLLGNT